MTDYVLSKIPEIKKLNVGIVNLFIQHTSAALTINGNSILYLIIPHFSHPVRSS